MRKMKQIARYADTLFVRLLLCLALSTSITACTDGGFLTVKPLGKQEQAEEANYVHKQQLYAEGRQDSLWGECDYWQGITIQSGNDVDTSANKLRRAAITDRYTLPHSNDAAINEQIARHWESPTAQPGIGYFMPPRYMWVQVGKFNQQGVVSYRISTDNQGERRGSLIDVVYCVGPDKGLGFYIPYRIEKPFKKILRAKFVAALK